MQYPLTDPDWPYRPKEEERDEEEERRAQSYEDMIGRFDETFDHNMP